MNYQGVIIEESLENKDILKDVKISDEKISWRGGTEVGVDILSLTCGEVK